MSSGPREWQPSGGPPPPPPPPRSAYYDSPSPYEHHREIMSPPYSGGYAGHQHGMMPPRRPPPDYWGYEHPPPPPRSMGPGPGWGARGPPPPHDSPGNPYDYQRMGPPYQHYPPPRSMPGRDHHYLPDMHHTTPQSTPQKAEKKEAPSTSKAGPPSSPASAAPPVASTPPRSNAAGFATPVRTKKNTSESSNSSASGKAGAKGRKRRNGKGDPLSLLAQVCNKAEDDEEEEEEDKEADPMRSPAPVPTSPAYRRIRPSPVITPTSTPSGKPPLLPHPQISPVDHRAEGGYWATEPPEHYPPRRPEGAPYPPSGPPPPGRPYGYPPQPGAYSEWPVEGQPPAIVERGSFDSVGEQEHGGPPRSAYDPRSRGPPLPPYHGQGEYRTPPPPHMTPQRGKYPPPRWSSYPPEHGMRPGYPPYPSEMGGPPYAGMYQPPPPVHSYPLAQHRSYPPPPPPPPMHYRPEVGPYTYVQQPHLEEKTILRKKFSWKHYPELERFLIANRDEYLKHSSMNYTAEQKQYNNWLTERLLEVAAENHYAFDPEEFNFVAIRDRIRCYYKSYVQTARKRGLNIPAKTESPIKRKKARTEEDEGNEKDGEQKESKESKNDIEESAGLKEDKETTLKGEEEKEDKKETENAK